MAEHAAPERHSAIDIWAGHFGIQADFLDPLTEFLAQMKSIGEIAETSRSPSIISGRKCIH